MGRAKAILQSEFPYNISGRCINREWFRLSLDEVWNIFSEELYLTAKLYNMRTHSFVLMSNHFHLIASTPDSNISQCMHRLLGNVSRRLNEQGNRINETFAGRHFKTILQHPSYFLNTYKYNYRNPVAAGFCRKVEDYPYSTLYGLLGRRHMLIPIEEDSTFMGDPEGVLHWLNEVPSAEKIEAVRYALKRQYYRVKKSRQTNAPLIGLEEKL